MSDGERTPAGDAEITEDEQKVAASQYFKRTKERARKLVDDPRELDRIADAADDKVRSKGSKSSSIGEVLEDLKTLIRLVRAGTRGVRSGPASPDGPDGDGPRDRYDIGVDTLVLVVAAVLYFVSPIDLIPDPIPLAGYVDDALVIRLVVKLVRGELAEFREWEAARAPQP